MALFIEAPITREQVSEIRDMLYWLSEGRKNPPRFEPRVTVAIADNVLRLCHIAKGDEIITRKRNVLDNLFAQSFGEYVDEWTENVNFRRKEIKKKPVTREELLTSTIKVMEFAKTGGEIIKEDLEKTFDFINLRVLPTPELISDDDDPVFDEDAD